MLILIQQTRVKLNVPFLTHQRASLRLQCTGHGLNHTGHPWVPYASRHGQLEASHSRANNKISPKPIYKDT